MKKEVARVTEESKELQQHLNTQLKVNAEGNESIQKKLEDLRAQNETLRVNLSTVQQKPGRAELRQLTIIENAIGLMREQAPGFAPAWEKAHRQAEVDYEEGEGGLKKLVRRVLPSIGHSSTIHEKKKPRRLNTPRYLITKKARSPRLFRRLIGINANDRTLRSEKLLR